MRIFSLRTAAALATLGLMFGLGCDCGYPHTDPNLGPRLIHDCLPPETWVDSTCEDICADLYAAVCTTAKECQDVPVRGFKRYDACRNNEFEHSSILDRECEDPLPESLTDSIYYISCCCENPGG